MCGELLCYGFGMVLARAEGLPKCAYRDLLLKTRCSRRATSSGWPQQSRCRVAQEDLSHSRMRQCAFRLWTGPQYRAPTALTQATAMPTQPRLIYGVAWFRSCYTTRVAVRTERIGVIRTTQTRIAARPLPCTGRGKEALVMKIGLGGVDRCPCDQPIMRRNHHIRLSEERARHTTPVFRPAWKRTRLALLV